MYLIYNNNIYINSVRRDEKALIFSKSLYKIVLVFVNFQHFKEYLAKLIKISPCENYLYSSVRLLISFNCSVFRGPNIFGSRRFYFKIYWIRLRQSTVI